jgi:hypothetical protein
MSRPRKAAPAAPVGVEVRAQLHPQIGDEEAVDGVDEPVAGRQPHKDLLGNLVKAVVFV